MVSKSSKWELDFVHYIAKFTKLRFAISRFECTFKKKKNSKGYFFSQKRVEQNEQKVGGAELEDRKLSLYTRRGHGLKN